MKIKYLIPLLSLAGYFTVSAQTTNTITNTNTTASDPIDRLVAKLSSDPRWQDGITSIRLGVPATASAEEVVSKEFARPATMPAISYKILKIRQVHIQPITPDSSYTAVLVQMDVGKEILLLQYSPNVMVAPVSGDFSGWWIRIYDAETLVSTGIR